MKPHFPRGLPKIKRNLKALKSVDPIVEFRRVDPTSNQNASSCKYSVSSETELRTSCDDKLRVTLAFGEQRVETNLQLFEPCSLMADCGNLLLYQLKRITDLR